MLSFEKKDCFSLEQTFLCGQCFRWNMEENGAFVGVAGDKAAKLYYDSNGAVCVESTCEDEKFWSEYLNLSFDYKKAAEFLSFDENLKKASNSGKGIRILKQELWETTVSFIISANNNIPRIKKIIESFCELFGDEIIFDKRKFFAFPEPKKVAQLSLSDLAPIKAGFRDKYILEAAKKFAEGKISFEKIKTMSDLEAKNTLMQIKGVGSKVADCILLFSLERGGIFPLDVWTKRIIGDLYGVGEKDIPQFVAQRFKNYGGIAQQYLYYYYAIQKK